MIAGQDLAQTVPNLAIQLGVVAGALALSRWENGLQQKLERRVRARLQSEGKDKNA
ncbi:MAG: photosystem II assembly family protein [Cyanobacteria bacterium P01_D01_bin.123]